MKYSLLHRYSPFSMLKAWVRLILLFALTGCAIPAALEGGPFDTSTPDRAEQKTAPARVHWGGELIETTRKEKETCFKVRAYGLDRYARPWKMGGKNGEFMACIAGFYDPAVYEPGRMLTLVGSVIRAERDYVQVAAETVYLWSGWHGRWQHDSGDC